LFISTLARHGLLPHIPLGVIPYGTGNNLVRSFGLERDSEKALVTIRQGHTTRLDISLVNQAYYGINVSFGLFPYLLARRVTNSLVGYTYETIRHIGFQPWPMRIRYTDAAGHTITLPSQRYILGTMLNTSHYGSIMRMAPDVMSDDGLFDVKLIRATPRVLYPFMFTIMLTGIIRPLGIPQRRCATHVELCPRPRVTWKWTVRFSPSRQRYCIQIAWPCPLARASATREG
jgi:diacylglycerol kinase family enzyme